MINGIKSANCPQGLEVRDGNAKYYVIENNDEFVDDFIIFVKNSNWITINIKNFLDKEYINLIFNYLKKNGYVHLSVYIPKEEKNILKAIRTNFNNIEETMIYQNKLEYIKIQVNL